MTPRQVRRHAPAIAALLLVATACSATGADGAGSGTTGTSTAATTTASPSTASSPLDLTSLETERDARVGVHAVDTGTGRTVAWRDEERFAFASTIKALAAAVVLDRTTDAELDQVVTWSEDDLVTYSPVTEQHVENGLPLREVVEAAVTVSDNTAGNVMFDQIGGPAALDQALEAVGDDVTQVVRVEPDLNEATPEDPRDTTTPRALASSLRAFAVDDALTAEDREQLVAWLTGSTTGNALVRSVVAEGWTVGDKTGSGGYGTRNDVAVVWPPDGGAPVVISVMSTHDDASAESDDEIVATAACLALRALDLPVRETGC